jgi:hypothetical protein
VPDRFYNAFQIGHHLLIGETKDLKALRCKEGVTLSVRLHLVFEIVRSAVELDNQLRGMTKEIDDVILDRGLPAKAEAINPTSFQVTPKQSLGRRH